MRKADVLKLPSMPLAGPSYPAGPYRFIDREFLVISYETDPDLIRVGNDYYLTGTTMHAMPGLPVLHSRDLVNWELMSYAVDRLDLGPRYRLDGGEIYGQGIWAPSFRHHVGTFHIFSNVNGVPLDDERFFPLFQTCERLRCPVLLQLPPNLASWRTIEL